MNDTMTEPEDRTEELLTALITWYNGGYWVIDEKGYGDDPITRQGLQDEFPPQLVLDIVIPTMNTRLIQVICSIDSSGGYNTLTGFFDYNSGQRLNPEDNEDPSWNLNNVTMEFDTYINIIMNSGTIQFLTA